MTFTVLKSIKVLNPKTYFNDISDVVICNDKIFSICKDFKTEVSHQDRQINIYDCSDYRGVVFFWCNGVFWI